MDGAIYASSARIVEWERGLPDTDHVRFFKSIDWSKTGVGASVEDWPVELLCWTQQLLSDSRPAVVYWGPSYTMLYNEAFIPHCGSVHPAAMGSTFSMTYPEIEDIILPMFQAAHESRAATDVNEIPLNVMRNGFLEEAYFTGNFTPLRFLSGGHAGIYNAVMEVTKQYISDRRRSTLNMIPLSSVQLTTANVWNHMIKVLHTNGSDFPLVLLYQLVQSDQIDDNHRLMLRGHIGLNEEDSNAMSEVCISDDVGLMNLVRQARSSAFTREILDSELQGIKWAGHGSRSKHISAAPLQNAGVLYGYVIVALNPRRPIGNDWLQFVIDLSRQLASTVASAVTTEEAASRERKLQHQILESERQIRYMAQHSDISMQQLSLDRRTIWANQHYWNLVGRQDTSTRPDDVLFEDPFLEDSREKALSTWQQVTQGQKAHTTELKLQRMYKTPDGGLMPTTILLSAFPYMVDGKVRSVMACMTEVSRLKWAETLQATMARDATEAKKLQSQFTDAISHEVRNPLSAMLQLAEDILASVAMWQERSSPVTDDTAGTLKEITDAAKTILVCARHQKRIVDDVLTLSKMDLANMTLNPATIRLRDLVSHAVKIMAADAIATNTRVTVVQESSVEALALDQVICDSLRITQVLINLLSNAIKFTKDQAHRNITISYGATSANPRAALPGVVRWAYQRDEQASNRDLFTGPDWGSGKYVYLTFQIRDTGLGMNEEEMERVFDRFEQASPQTSIKYGGSGLGLFICRSLSQRQCGGIGISSCLGKGTTTAFYVGSRIAMAAVTNEPMADLTVGSNSSSNPTHNEAENSHSTRTPRSIARVHPGNTGKPHHDLHILLVEDNLINQKVLCKQLTRAGCKVYVANHGIEALDFLRSTVHWSRDGNPKGDDNYNNANKAVSTSNTTTATATSIGEMPIPLDVILMDLNMPIMDGLTCTTQIRTLERTGIITSHLEIIVVTANARREQAEEARSVGADAVLRKPFVVSELLELIDERLGKRG